MESRSESTNSGARIDEVADHLCARIEEIGDNHCARIAEEFSSLRARIAENIRYERQTQLMIFCAGAGVLESGGAGGPAPARSPLLRSPGATSFTGEILDPDFGGGAADRAVLSSAAVRQR